MSQKRLNELVLLSIEKDFLNEINYDNLIDNFASQKVQKINFRSKYHKVPPLSPFKYLMSESTLT